MPQLIALQAPSRPARRRAARASERERPATLAEEVLRKISTRPRHVAWRAHEVLVGLGRSLPEARVLVVGASYKPGIADTREAPALEIIARLRGEGAHVDYHDPLVPEVIVDGALSRGMAAPWQERPWAQLDGLPESRGGATASAVRERASGGLRSSAPVLDPEAYDLTILTTLHPGCDYGWLKCCPMVLDCTYRSHDAGRRRFTP